jgi:glycerol-3-phosphate O-acyltransferase / dihydroxyacetone phosphate acyltransferase
MLSHTARFVILRLVGLFYPRLEVRGRANLPAGAPTLFVANHPNGLLDPLVIIRGVGRHVAFLAKSTFFGNPLGALAMRAFDALPVYRQRDEGQEGGAQGDRALRNEATFARCRVLLRAGQPLALFPEGTTHSQPSMLPLRTGAARIALSAEAEAGWRLHLRVVPVGVWYERKAEFRSSVLLVIGQPFAISSYEPAYAADPHAAADELTDEIDRRLDGVVLQAEHAEVIQGLPILAEWTSPHELRSVEARHARAAQLLSAYTYLRAADPQRLAAIERHARQYARVLRMLGIDDPWELELSAARRGRIVGLAMALLIGLLPAAMGFALSYGPYRLAAPLTPRLMGDYKETTSTGKLIIGSVLILLGWLIAALIFGWLFGVLWGVLVFILAPPLAYVALRWGEGWHELRETVEAHWLTLRHGDLVHELAARRRALADEVAEAIHYAQMHTVER